MTWDPAEYGNTTVMPVAVTEYWTPGFYLRIFQFSYRLLYFTSILDIFLYSAADSGSFNQWDTSCIF